MSITLFLLLLYGVYRGLHNFVLDEFYLKATQSFPNLKFVKINYWAITYEGLTIPLDISPIYLSLFINIGAYVLNLRFLKKDINIKVFLFNQGFFLLTLLLISSRSQLIIFIFIFFSTFFIFRKRLAFFTLLGTIPILILIAITNPLILNRFKTTLNTDSSLQISYGGLALREKKWNSATDLILKEKIFGYGIGDAKGQLLKKYYEDGFTFGGDNQYNCHNQYLETTLQGGIILSSLLIFILIYLLYISFKRKNYLLFCTIVLFTISFITESVLERQRGVLAFVFFICFFNKFNQSFSIKGSQVRWKYHKH
jgi:O-antigen ligase